jgi:DNA-binding LacI/PurR family transcriptional regulator
MTSVDEDSKTPPLQDLDDAVGLHISTVSPALSGKGTLSAAIRERVLITACARGYRPNPLAQRLESNISSLVCILSSPPGCGSEHPKDPAHRQPLSSLDTYSKGKQ